MKSDTSTCQAIDMTAASGEREFSSLARVFSHQHPSIHIGRCLGEAE
jgi:hypothetical protein